MNFAVARHNMVVQQLERRGIHDPRVLEAMDWVPRQEFVPPEVINLAYEDRAIPIGLEQTISQPYTVAYMCQEARITADDKVMEIGTGSGYGAAVLSLLAREVFTVERIEELHDLAKQRLERIGYRNVHAVWDDGTIGLPNDAPFNVIIVTAGAESIPGAFEQQLAIGGRLMMPVGPPSQQQMIRVLRRDNQLERDNLGSFGFVPLVADAQDHAPR